MGFWIGDQTGMSGDTISPAPFGGSMGGSAYGGMGGSPSPAYPVASPGSAATPGGSTLSIPSVVGTPAAPAMPFGFGGGTPSSGYTAPSTDPLTALFGGGSGGAGGLGPLLSLLGLGGGGGTDPISALLSGGSSLAGLFGGGGFPGPGGVATIGGDLGSLGTSGLSSLFGLNQTGTGANIAQDVGMLLGGPAGILSGLLANWIGGGLNKMVKPEGAVSALNSMGGIDAMLGQYIQNQGINKGFDLSEPQGTTFNPAAYGDILQLLGGQSLGENAIGEIPLGNVPGAQKPVTLYGFEGLPQLQGKNPNATELSQEQLKQIAPQLQAMADRWHPGGLEKILQQASQLAMKLKAAETY